MSWLWVFNRICVYVVGHGEMITCEGTLASYVEDRQANPNVRFRIIYFR